MRTVFNPDGMCGMSGMCDVTRYQLDTKGLLFLSIYVHIIFFSTKKVFYIKHLCQHCIVLLINFECMLKSKTSLIKNL